MRRSHGRDLIRVFRWDLRYILRDRKTILLMFVLPVVLYPLVMWGSQAATTSKATKKKQTVLEVKADPDFSEWLRPKDKLKVVQTELRKDSKEGPQAAVDLPTEDQPATIHYHSDQPQGRRAMKRVRRVLRRAQAAERQARFEAAKLQIDPKEVLQVDNVDVATAADKAGINLGRIIPLVLVFLGMGGGMNTALDLFAGERERGTIETLLTSRVSRTSVLGAKFLLVLLATLVTSVLALASLGLCLYQGWFGVPESATEGITTTGLCLAAALAVPLVVQLSAAQVALAAYVPDFKTGQFMVTPAMLLAMLPAGVSMIPGISLSPLLAMLPITNVALTTQEVMLSSPRWGLVALAVGVSLLHTAGALWLGARWMSREAAIFGHPGQAARHAKGRYGVEAIGIFAVVLLLFWFVGQSSMQWNLVWGLVLTQVLLIALPAVGVVKWLGLPLATRLQLRRPAGRDLLLALLAGLLAPCVADLVFQAQQGLLPISEQTLQAMEETLSLDLPLWGMVLLIAVLPAFCEEFLFRGAILGLLKNNLGPVARCVVVALLFGLLHLMLIRILPTASLGLLLTAAAMRSRSLWVPILMHLLNNGLVITADTLGWGGPGDLGVGAEVACVVICVLAVAGMGRTRS